MSKNDARFEHFQKNLSLKGTKKSRARKWPVRRASGSGRHFNAAGTPRRIDEISAQ
jgi:hypothetical protein